jgi:hypothetical protein
MKPEDLAAKPKKDLLELAKKHSIAGRSAMSKEELARAIARSAATSGHSSKADAVKGGVKKRPAGAKPATTAKPSAQAKPAAKAIAKPLAKKAMGKAPEKPLAERSHAEKQSAERPTAERPPTHEPRPAETQRAPEPPRHEAQRPPQQAPTHRPEPPRGDRPQRPMPPGQGGSRPPQRGPMDKRGGPHDSRGPRRGMPPIDPAMKLSRVEEIRRDSPGRGGRPGGPGGRYQRDQGGPRGPHTRGPLDRGPGGRDDRRPPMRGDRFPQRGPSGPPPPPARGSLAEERAHQAREHLRRSGEARRESPYTPQHDRPIERRDDRMRHDRPQHDRPQHDRPQHDRPQHDRPQHDRPQHDRPQHDRPQQGPRDRSQRDRRDRGRGEPRRGDPHRIEAPRTAPIPERFSPAPERRSEPPQAPPTPRPAGIQANRPPEMPAAYGVDRLAIMVRDPYWLHSYWEVTPESIVRAKEQLADRWEGHRWILRVHTYSEGNGQAGPELFDIDVHPEAHNWYFRVPQPDCSYEGMIGVLTRDGTFYPFARSNRVRTPRDTMSDVTDVQWATTREEFERIYTLSGGHSVGVSSGEVGEETRRKGEETYFSGMLGSMGSGTMGLPKHRGFWFQVNTELILYGATEPNAKLKVQGRTIELRPDGTFTLRFQLPDGVQELPCVALSADGISERTITPVVRRHTTSSERELNPNPGDVS